jgi:ribosomal protein S14
MPAMSNANTHVLPDSRLKDRSLGSVVGAWEMPDGSTVRVECARVYCANCGRYYGLVPEGNTTFAFWLCRKCFETHGPVAGTWAVPEEEFCRAVAHEMEAKHGRHLTDVEIAALGCQGRLGKELELLARESPFAVPGH